MMNLAIVVTAITVLLSTQISANSLSNLSTSDNGFRMIHLAENTFHHQHYAYKKNKKRHKKGAKKKRSKRRSRPRGSLPRKRSATGGKVFVFSPRYLQWGAYDANGKMIKSGRASGGKNYCPDVKRRCLTPRGSFRVYSRRGAGCKSSKFPVGRGGSPMPYCMFFYGGYAVHGSYNVPNYNASHGCIRVRPDAAKWLNKSFMTNGTRVIVTPY